MELEGCLSRVYGGTERAGSITEQSKVNRQQEKSRGKRELPLPPKKIQRQRARKQDGGPESQNELPQWDVVTWLGSVR